MPRRILEQRDRKTEGRMKRVGPKRERSKGWGRDEDRQKDTEVEAEREAERVSGRIMTEKEGA